jgi:hypothetical protein
MVVVVVVLKVLVVQLRSVLSSTLGRGEWPDSRFGRLSHMENVADAYSVGRYLLLAGLEILAYVRKKQTLASARNQTNFSVVLTRVLVTVPTELLLSRLI